MTTPDLQVTPAVDRIVAARRRMADLRVPHRRGIVRPDGPSRADMLWQVARGRLPSVQFVETLAAIHPISYVRAPRGDLYCLSDPDLIWQLFGADAARTIKGSGLQSARPIIGDGLLLSEDPKHRRNRSLVQPAFTRRQIAGYADQMTAAALDRDAEWTRRTSGGEAAISVTDEMSALTLDVVGRTIFGSDLTGASAPVAASLKTLLPMITIMLSPKWDVYARFNSRPRRRLVAAIEQLDAVVSAMIADKRAALAAGEPPDDMLALLITASDPETGATLTAEELRDEALNLVLAGHETTANLLSWTWLLLAQHPDVKEWATSEWDAAGGSPLGYDAVARLPRTRAVLAETMRLFPPAWAIDRRTTADLEFGGYLVPEGAIVLASPYVMHRDPRYWADPGRFDPGRWLDADGGYSEKQPDVPRGVWFPFGFGARRCIGDQFALAEAALLLATLGPRWHVVPTDPAAIRPRPGITLRPSTTMPAALRRR